MGLLFGHQTEAPETAHNEFQKETKTIFESLESRQKVLEC